jgi:hypothetical protein
MSLRVRICHEVCGTWSVGGLSAIPVKRLPSLSASLDYARHECAEAPATIELLIDGFYAVFHQERGWRGLPRVRETEHCRQLDEVFGIDCRSVGYSSVPAVARSRSSWFIEWCARTISSIATFASGFVDRKRSKSAFRKESSRQ